MDLSALATVLPLTASPFLMVAFGQDFFKSASLLPMALPSCVQNGRIVFPVKLCFSKKESTTIGIVPHQFG